ncbi:virulence RhuM family protein [uncultured Desulfobacter sp.]|uniref:virulence RhuM family protein n=1 Tax=uncultured Desulfobacter sp. TaxID=240139 RepID=UPI002AABA27B|nr:virulence RhuM family protein [uncultured Desulfobacter sp.]
MESDSSILIYEGQEGNVKIDVRLQDETVWLTQKDMAELFQTTKQNIGQHLKKIFAEGELDENLVVKKFFTTASDGKKYQTAFYSLDAIISTGYRIKSHIATRFRQWATQRLKEYIIKGFTLNDERFKTGSSMNYFTELQERIREIRLSERFFYQKIKDIYTTSIDYDPRDENTVLFFKTIQNKLLWAISQQTAAELIYRRVDASLPLMGMQSFDKKGNGAVTKKDVSIAKNYLDEDEMKLLGLLVEQYLAFAETMAQQQTPMYMKDWIQRLDAIIQLNGRDLLTHAGKISRVMADERSAIEYDKYRQEKKRLNREESMKELERDIKQLSPKKNEK